MLWFLRQMVDGPLLHWSVVGECLLGGVEVSKPATASSSVAGLAAHEGDSDQLNSCRCRRWRLDGWRVQVFRSSVLCVVGAGEGDRGCSSVLTDAAGLTKSGIATKQVVCDFGVGSATLQVGCAIIG